MYNSAYPIIDENMTDGNVGCRKERSARDNIFVMGAVTNSIINGKCKPIQAQVMDIKTCFDKLWLEAALNALYENGLQNDMLNLLFIENKTTNIAIKVNNILSKRTNVTNVIMQGSVWGGLKCTSQMDILNKICNENENLQYRYKSDPNITIGVRGMVDDTLALAECGNPSILKNTTVNSFVETKRLQMHRDKSVVLHVGNVEKCKRTCPQLKVHEDIMPEKVSTKYLGNIISANGGVSETVEDRRSKGWGKVAALLGVLGEVDMGSHRVEIGLLMRKAILVSSLLWSAEAWSDIKERDLKRLEQVDSAYLKSLVKGHSKNPKNFHHLETGKIKIRHNKQIDLPQTHSDKR